MKIIITGSLGHISKPLTQDLVQKGHTVTVISHNPERQAEIETLGANAAIGSIDDIQFLISAFSGEDAIYTMIPPSSANGFSDPSMRNGLSDALDRCNKIMNNYSLAIHKSGVKRVIHLSSIGAHMAKNSGLLILHYNAEAVLNKLENVDVTFMRPVGFYYNLLNFIPTIKNMGVIASNYGGDDIIPWVSPIDIAAAIAEEFENPKADRKVIYVASEEISCNDLAKLLGESIGKRDLKWIIISGEQLQTGMEKAGVPFSIAASLVEMNAATHNGLIYEDYYLNRPTLGNVKLKDFAKEFAAVYLNA